MSYEKYSPTWSLDTFRELDGGEGIEKPLGFPEYDSSLDWCGPEDNPKLAAMIPDAIMGVSVSIAGYRHDLGYATPKKLREGWCRPQYIWRLCCDHRFRADLMTLIRESDLGGGDLKLAKRFAKMYYWSVRFGGWKHCER